MIEKKRRVMDVVRMVCGPPEIDGDGWIVDPRTLGDRIRPICGKIDVEASGSLGGVVVLPPPGLDFPELEEQGEGLGRNTSRPRFRSRLRSWLRMRWLPGSTSIRRLGE